MRVIFYPRDIGMWRTGEFDFSVRGNITATCREKADYKIFNDRAELIVFLKEHRVQLNDPLYPLEFDKRNSPHDIWGDNVYDIIQWSLIGWMKEIC